jgi:hypothetical protein
VLDSRQIPTLTLALTVASQSLHRPSPRHRCEAPCHWIPSTDSSNGCRRCLAPRRPSPSPKPTAPKPAVALAHYWWARECCRHIPTPPHLGVSPLHRLPTIPIPCMLGFGHNLHSCTFFLVAKRTRWRWERTKRFKVWVTSLAKLWFSLDPPSLPLFGEGMYSSRLRCDVYCLSWFCSVSDELALAMLSNVIAWTKSDGNTGDTRIYTGSGCSARKTLV